MPQKPVPCLAESFERRGGQGYQVFASGSPERFLLGVVDAKVVQCMAALHHLRSLAKITAGDEVQARWSRSAHAATVASSGMGTEIMMAAGTSSVHVLKRSQMTRARSLGMPMAPSFNAVA